MKTIDIADLYSKRLLVFIEDEDLPNEYHQVIFSAEHFKKVSDAVCGDMPKSTENMREGYEVREMQMSEKTYKLPDEFTDFNIEPK